MLSDEKVKPYQFGLATISGFRDHSEVTRTRTNQNQLVNIYLIRGIEGPCSAACIRGRVVFNSGFCLNRFGPYSRI